jgi:hypothetical protein
MNSAGAGIIHIVKIRESKQKNTSDTNVNNKDNRLWQVHGIILRDKTETEENKQQVTFMHIQY